MPNKTVADAHREAAVSIIANQWGIAFAEARDGVRGVDAMNAAIDVATKRIADLTAVEAPPADLDDFVDAYFTNARARLAEDLGKWKTIVNNPDLGALLYGEQEGNPAVRLASITARIDALDSVWTAP